MKYNRWFEENVKEGGGKQSIWAYAIYQIKDWINKNMVSELSTLQETKGVVGKAQSYFPVNLIFSDIDKIRKEYLKKTPHPTLLQMEAEKLMAILYDLEICTRHVIQNTSIRRLHVKSWVHSDALGGQVGNESLSGRGGASLAPVGEISSLLCQMKEM
jgi:hypothetical protein